VIKTRVADFRQVAPLCVINSINIHVESTQMCREQNGCFEDGSRQTAVASVLGPPCIFAYVYLCLSVVHFSVFVAGGLSLPAVMFILDLELDLGELSLNE